MRQVALSRLRRCAVLLGTVLLLAVTSAQAVHVICHVNEDAADATAVHDMTPHAVHAPCMLCVNAHSPAGITVVAGILPARARTLAFLNASARPRTHRAVFGLYVRPPPGL